MQLLFLISIVPAIILQNTAFLSITAFIFTINVLIYAMNKTKYEAHLDSLNSIISIVKVGNKIIDSNLFTNENELRDLKDVAKIFRNLTRIIGKIQRTKNASLVGNIDAIVYDYLIGSTLMDFLKYNRSIKVLTGKQKEFMKLYKIIGEIDMQISLASFRESLPIFCRPQFTEQHKLEMTEIYHPLIDNPICNTISMDKGCIITGSNASGKSTFIKAVAINIILAQSIHTCMAKQIMLPFASVITSMAIRDDLASGESYYIKEIKYLNRIIKHLSEERLIICSIDEILRGTNTQERIAACAAILKFLCQKNCIAIVASHDIELTEMLNGLYENFHFREQIKENDIYFEYKIHEGSSNSKNAIRLLEYVNFPNEIIEDARNTYVGRRI